MEAARPATDADLPKIADLVRAAIEELAPMRGGAVWKAQESRPEPIEDALGRVLADSGARVLAGTIDDVILGYAVVRVERLQDGSHLGVIDDIYVDPGARQVGLGETMMQDMIGWCRQRECIGIDSMALPGHRSSKNFFEESGFTARKLVMHKRLAGRSDP